MMSTFDAEMQFNERAGTFRRKDCGWIKRAGYFVNTLAYVIDKKNLVPHVYGISDEFNYVAMTYKLSIPFTIILYI